MPSGLDTAFQMGDRVVHPAKPEWGSGLIASAQASRQDGKPCQRLQVRFDRGGLKTINTAFVELKPADQHDALPSQDPGDPFATGGDIDPVARMTALDDSATDPFATPTQRLEASLRLYRFDRTGASLLDWAAAQSGMRDPLTRFNRHELEEFFDRWAYLREQHLLKTVRESLIADPQGTATAAKNAPESARPVLQRATRRG